MSAKKPISLREAESIVNTMVALAQKPAGAAVFGRQRGLILSKQVRETEGRGSDVKLAEYVAGLALKLGHDTAEEKGADLHQDDLRILHHLLVFASHSDEDTQAMSIDPQVPKGGILLIDNDEIVGSVAVAGEEMTDTEADMLARKGKAAFDAIRRSEPLPADV